MNTMRALRETLEGGVILPEPFATDCNESPGTVRILAHSWYGRERHSKVPKDSAGRLITALVWDQRAGVRIPPPRPILGVCPRLLRVSALHDPAKQLLPPL